MIDPKEIAAAEPKIQGVVSLPCGLHPETAALVLEFADALAEKLRVSELKHGFTNEWAFEIWEEECQHQLRSHIRKGDPLDVGAYAAFMWKRRWSTKSGPTEKA